MHLITYQPYAVTYSYIANGKTTFKLTEKGSFHGNEHIEGNSIPRFVKHEWIRITEKWFKMCTHACKVIKKLDEIHTGKIANALGHQKCFLRSNGSNTSYVTFIARSTLLTNNRKKKVKEYFECIIELSRHANRYWVVRVKAYSLVCMLPFLQD